MKGKTIKFLMLGGVFGPLLFMVIVLICASFRPEYDHLHQFISELGATGTPNFRWMNYAGFVPTGLLILAFGIAMFASAKRSFIARIASILLALFASGILLSGLFSCDQGCPDWGSQESNIHQKIAPVAFMCAIGGILMSGISFRRRPQWRKYWLYSVLSSAVALACMLALVNSLDTRMFTGLWQRLMLLVIFVWMGISGIHGFKNAEDKRND